MEPQRPTLLLRALVAAALISCAAPTTLATQPTPPSSPQTGAATKQAYDRAVKAAKLADAGNKQMAGGNLEAARRSYLEADTLVPDNCSVLIALSSVQLRLGESDAALATLERAIRRGKAFNDKAYLLVARIFSERKDFLAGQTKLIEWAGSRPVTANFHAAIGILRMGAYELAPAEIEMREALKLEPANEAALTGMSELYGRLNQYAKLQPFLDAGLAKKPDSVTLLLLTGNSLLRQERFAEAKRSYERIVKIDPKNAAAMVNLGACFHGLGDTQAAQRWFQKAIEADGKNVEAPINLARAFEKAGQPAEGRDVLIAARKRGLDSIEILNSLVVAYRLTKEYDAALAVAAESLKRAPGQAQLKMFAGEIERERAGAASGSASAGPAAQQPPKPPAPDAGPVRP